MYLHEPRKGTSKQRGLHCPTHTYFSDQGDPFCSQKGKFCSSVLYDLQNVSANLCKGAKKYIIELLGGNMLY